MEVLWPEDSFLSLLVQRRKEMAHANQGLSTAKPRNSHAI